MADQGQGGRLVLVPALPETAPRPALLVPVLHRIGFLGDPLERAGENAFLVGDRFLQLITFLGCSPHIELTPPPHGGGFCYIHLHGPHAEPRLLYGRNTRPPRCFRCKRPVRGWPSHAGQWGREPQQDQIDCSHCGQRQRPIDVLWRQDAGIARFFIQIEDIFPGEAVPVPTLLQELIQAADCPWRHFYLQD